MHESNNKSTTTTTAVVAHKTTGKNIVHNKNELKFISFLINFN